MIGRALDKPQARNLCFLALHSGALAPYFVPFTQMARVLANLTTLKAPWNCPHGRPTMRHLVADIRSLAYKFDE
jgi:DNA mismatch repair ATPase MutL